MRYDFDNLRNDVFVFGPDGSRITEMFSFLDTETGQAGVMRQHRNNIDDPNIDIGGWIRHVKLPTPLSVVTRLRVQGVDRHEGGPVWDFDAMPAPRPLYKVFDAQGREFPLEVVRCNVETGEVLFLLHDRALKAFCDHRTGDVANATTFLPAPLRVEPVEDDEPPWDDSDEAVTVTGPVARVEKARTAPAECDHVSEG